MTQACWTFLQLGCCFTAFKPFLNIETDENRNISSLRVILLVPNYQRIDTNRIKYNKKRNQYLNLLLLLAEITVVIVKWSEMAEFVA